MTARLREPARQPRGQALVEVSLVLPLLFFILFAIIEGSFLVFALESANFAAQAAETVLAQAGQDPTADAQALLAIRATALGQTRLADVQEIDFERVNPLGGPLGSINRYRLDGTLIGTAGWAPTSRNVQECCADFVKVTIKLRYRYRSGLLGAAPALSASSTGRLEPRFLNPGRPITGPFPAPAPVRGTPVPAPSPCTSYASVWTQYHPANNPPGRTAAAMAYDSGRLVDVLFGGRSQPTYLNDTWEWNGTDWRRLSPPRSPSPRSGAAMAYDPVRRKTILFGGEFPGAGGAGNLNNETWSWDGANWTRLNPPAPPVARAGARMIWNPDRARLVLFGGYGPPGTDLGGESAGTGGGNTYLGDSWEFDGSTWSRRMGGPRPAPRALFAYAFDPALGEVIYGGLGHAPGPLHPQDTWIFAGGAWTLVVRGDQHHPTNDLGMVSAFLPSHGGTIIAGGTTGALTAPTQAWELEKSALGPVVWGQLLPASSPPPLSEAAGALDARGGLLVMGGPVDTTGAAEAVQGTWELNKCHATSSTNIQTPTP